MVRPVSLIKWTQYGFYWWTEKLILCPLSGCLYLFLHCLRELVRIYCLRIIMQDMIHINNNHESSSWEGLRSKPILNVMLWCLNSSCNSWHNHIAGETLNNLADDGSKWIIYFYRSYLVSQRGMFTLNVNIHKVFEIKGWVKEVNPSTDHHNQQLSQNICINNHR